jgi:hypothetical protein
MLMFPFTSKCPACLSTPHTKPHTSQSYELATIDTAHITFASFWLDFIVARSLHNNLWEILCVFARAIGNLVVSSHRCCIRHKLGDCIQEDLRRKNLEKGGIQNWSPSSRLRLRQDQIRRNPLEHLRIHRELCHTKGQMCHEQALIFSDKNLLQRALV